MGGHTSLLKTQNYRLTELIRTLAALFTDCRVFRARHVCVPAGCQGMPGSERQAISEQVAPS